MGEIKGVCNSFSSLANDLTAESKKKKYCFKYQPRDNDSFSRPPSFNHPTKYAEKCKAKIIHSIAPLNYHSSSSPSLSPCSILCVRESTPGKAEEMWDISTSRNLQSKGEDDNAMTGKTWVAHRCGEGSKCSSWQFKRPSPTPGFPTSSAIVRFFTFLNLAAAGKKSTETERKQATCTLDNPIVRNQQLPGDKPRVEDTHRVSILHMQICAHHYFDYFTGHLQLYQADSH